MELPPHTTGCRPLLDTLYSTYVQYVYVTKHIMFLWHTRAVIELYMCDGHYKTSSSSMTPVFLSKVFLLVCVVCVLRVCVHEYIIY